MSVAIVQAKINTTQTTIDPSTSTMDLALFNQAGAPVTIGGIDADGAVTALKNKTQIAALSANATANAVAAAGANPTKAEYDAVVALANSLKTTLNAVIAALKA